MISEVQAEDLEGLDEDGGVCMSVGAGRGCCHSPRGATGQIGHLDARGDSFDAFAEPADTMHITSRDTRDGTQA